MKKVRFITQTRRTTPSIAAFEDELFNYFGWADDIDYDVYAANDDLTGALPTIVSNLFKETTAPDVIVSAGLMATTLLAKGTTTIPIIQAVGGGGLATPQANVTGFTLNASGTANYLLSKFNPGRTVTVLYNDKNSTSVSAYNSLNPPSNVTLANTPITIHDPAGFTRLTTAIDGFMLIPDAMFYKYHRKVAAMVEGMASQFCYPERLFKSAHENKAHVKVYGYHIPATFRLAASLVNIALNGTALPNSGVMVSAVTDNDS